MNFIGVGDESGPTIDIEAVEDGDAERQAFPHHRPARIGDLPPLDVRERYALSSGDERRPPGRPGDELDFYSAEADEEARDHLLAERTRRYREGGEDVPSLEQRLIEEDDRPRRPRRERETLAEKIRKMKPPTVTRSFR